VNREAEEHQGLENRLEGPIDGALHLLDRQLLDCDGKMLGKVDDVELVETAEGLRITAVLTGPAALLGRLGGRVGSGLVRTWVRLRVSEPERGRPWRIDLDDVDRLDSALHLSVRRDGVLRRDREEHRLGELTGMDVLGPDGARLGRVMDARFEPDTAGHLVLCSLIVGHGRPGSLLGYDRRGDQGPWLIRTVVRRIHRHTVVADATTADISWDEAVVRLSDRPAGRPDTARTG
jgi:sporulation protein YlmC with PRC-barrel domain